MATGEMKDLVQTTIDATCNDTKLHTALKKVLLEYFTNVVPVEDEGDLPMRNGRVGVGSGSRRYLEKREGRGNSNAV